MNNPHSEFGRILCAISCGARLVEVDRRASAYLSVCSDASEKRAVGEGDILLSCNNCHDFARCPLVKFMAEGRRDVELNASLVKPADEPKPDDRDGRLADVRDADVGREEFSASIRLAVKGCVHREGLKAHVVVAPVLPEMDDGRDGGRRRDEGSGRGDAGEDEVEKLNG